MSYINAFKELSGLNTNGMNKLSKIRIEELYYHRIQIKQIASLYKLSVKVKKPIILTLYTLKVLKHLVDHSQKLSSIFKLQNIYEIKIVAAGYGIFNQKYQLEQLSSLFVILAEYCKNIPNSLKKLTLEFPGWRTIDNNVLTNIFKFVKKCQSLEQFVFNINHAMFLQNKQKSQDKSSTEQDILYGKYSFGIQQFQLLMKYISSLLPRNSLIKLQLRFEVWKLVSSQIIQILIFYCKKLNENLQNLKVLKLDLNGWGIGNYQSQQNQIKQQKLKDLFHAIEQFEGETLQILQIDMRNWPVKYKNTISNYKQKFNYYSGTSRRKEDTSNNANTQIRSMSTTKFYYSYLKSKINKRVKIQIKD